MQNYFRSILYLFFVFLLVSCTSQSQLKLIIKSANFLNPNINNKPSPLILTIYQLSSNSAFSNSSFSMIDNCSLKLLGNSLIDKIEYEITPNTTDIKHIHLTNKTRFLGIVAGYHNLRNSNWKKTIPIPSKCKYHVLNISLDTYGVEISKLDSCHLHLTQLFYGTKP